MSKLVKKIIKNTVFVSLSRFISGFGGFLITPFLLRYLGLESFGVWSLLFIVIAYLNLLDLGLADTTVKFTAQFSARNDKKSIFNLFSLAVGFYLLLLMLLFLFYFIFRQFFDTNISLPQNSHLVFSQIFAAAIAYSITTSINNLIISVYSGLQKMEYLAFNQIIYTGGLFILTIFSIITRKPLSAIIWIPFFAQFIALLIQSFLIKITLPGFCFSFSLINKEFLKKTLSLGTGIQLTISAHTLNTQITKSLIASLGFDFLGIYELAFKVVAFLKSIPTVFLSPIFPAISELNTIDRAKRNRLISQGTKYLSLLSYPVFLLSFAFAPQLIKFWLGQDQPMVVLSLRLLLLAFLPDNLIGVVTTTLNGIGKVFIHVQYAIFILIFNTAAVFWFTGHGNYSAVLYVLPIIVVAASFWVLYQFSKQVLTLSFSFFWKNLTKSGLSASVSVLLVYIGFQLTSFLDFEFARFVLFSCLFFPLYLIFLFFLRFFSPEDKQLLLHHIKVEPLYDEK